MTIRNVISATLSAAVVLLPAATLLPTAGYAERDEIVVSVRRKDENLQDVPLSVSTIGGEELERYGITNLKDVVKYSPGLEFDEGFGAQDTRVVMRGLSPTRGRSNVALLVDGVDFTGEAVSTAGGGILVNQQLLDLERVEVVKGPQSALYGRSAFGGAIQYVTKKPSLEEFESSIGVDLSTNRNFRSDNRNTGRISAAAGGPIAENFGLRVNGLIYDNDGYYNNSVTGQAVGGSEGHGIALTGLWKPRDTLTVSGRIASSSDEYEPRAQARVASNLLVDLNDSLAVVTGIPGPGQTNSLVRGSSFSGYPDCAGAPTERDGTITSCLGTPKVLVAGVMPDADQLRVIQNENPRTGSNYPGTDVDTLTATLQLNWQFSGGEFSSTTGYVDLDSQQLIDGQWDALSAGMHTSLDGTYSFTLPPCGFSNCSPTVQEINFNNETKLFSQEFRFASDLDGPLNYTVGALFWNEEVDQIEKSISISPALARVAPGPPGQPVPVEIADAGNAVIFGGVNSPNDRKVIRDTESISLYGQVEWDLSDDLTLSFEARWIDEELEVAGGVCDVAATATLTGYPTQTVAGEDFCWQSFRGGSSVAEVLAPGTSLGGPFGPFTGVATLPVGTQTQAATMLRTAKFSDSFVAPKVTLQWDQSDTQMYYASIAQGIKPGGVSTITAGSFFSPDANLFDKEELLSFEIGSKSTLMDGDLVLNSTLFYQDYTDKQVGVTRFDPVIQTDVGSIENAGKSEIYGLEIDAMWQVTERLSLSGGYTYVDSEYSEFIIETTSANNVARSLAAGGGGCLRLIDNDPGDPADGQSDICVVDLSGNAVEDVPEHSFVGNARYVAPLADTGLEWYADASFIYRDERAIDEFNVKWLDSYWTTDLRGGLVGDNWEVIAYINNLFDDDTVRTGVDVGSQVNTVLQGQFPPGPSDGVIVSLPDPRVYGLRVMYEF